MPSVRHRRLSYNEHRPTCIHGIVSHFLAGGSSRRWGAVRI